MRSLVSVVLTLSQPLTGQKPLQLVNAIPPELPLVWADENRLQQILHNLVGNAIKFTDTGTVEVSATLVAGDVETRHVASGSRGAGEQRSRGAGEQGSRGAGEQGSRGAEERRKVKKHLLSVNSQ
jgi:signal transduction histidine kinase